LTSRSHFGGHKADDFRNDELTPSVLEVSTPDARLLERMLPLQLAISGMAD
jgi:hypothetical protein